MARRRAPELELRRMIHVLVPGYRHPSIEGMDGDREVWVERTKERALGDSPSGRHRVGQVVDPVGD